jgi:hypothetical protein
VTKCQDEINVWREKFAHLGAKAASQSYLAAFRVISSQDGVLMRTIISWWRELHLETKNEASQFADEERFKHTIRAELRSRTADLGSLLIDKCVLAVDEPFLIQQAVFTAWKEIQMVSIQAFKRKCDALGPRAQKFAYRVALSIMTDTQQFVQIAFNHWKEDWLVIKLRHEVAKRCRKATANLVLHLVETSCEPVYVLQICFSVWREGRLYSRLRRVVKGMKARCRFIALQTALVLQRTSYGSVIQEIFIEWRSLLSISRVKHEVDMLRSSMNQKDSKVIKAAQTAALWLICYQDETLASTLLRLWKEFCFDARQHRRSECLRNEMTQHTKDKTSEIAGHMVRALDGCRFAVVARIVVDVWKEALWRKRHESWQEALLESQERSNLLASHAALGLRLWAQSSNLSVPLVVWLCQVTSAWSAAVQTEKVLRSHGGAAWNRAKEVQESIIGVLGRNTYHTKLALTFRVWHHRVRAEKNALECAQQVAAALACACAAGGAGGRRIALVRVTATLRVALCCWYVSSSQGMLLAHLATMTHFREKAAKAADTICLHVPLPEKSKVCATDSNKIKSFLWQIVF